MKKFNYIVRMMLVLVVTFMTFSGAALTAQAAEPHSHSHRWEQRDDRDYPPSRRRLGKEPETLGKKTGNNGKRTTNQNPRKKSIKPTVRPTSPSA